MNILTFDIEEWFQSNADSYYFDKRDKWDSLDSNLINQVDTILDLLNKTKQRATFFVVGWVAEKYPEIIKKIDLAGFEIGYHSYYHELVSSMTKEEFREDLRKGKAILNNIINKTPKYFRASNFSVNKDTMWIYEILCEEGFEIDCSIFPAKRRLGGYPGFKYSEPFVLKVNDNYSIKILPQNLVKKFGLKFTFSGGKYFQVIPFSLIKKWNKNSSYKIWYFHPLEFDSNPSFLIKKEKSKILLFFFYIFHSKNKLIKLFNIGKFEDIRTAERGINWENIYDYSS